MKLFGILVCFQCVNFLMASETYKAGVLHLQNKDISDCNPYIYEARNKGVDILVLPSPKPSSMDNYHEAVKTLSMAAKQAGLYVVAHLHEKTSCQVGFETVRSNLVFDRSGSIVAVKPLANVANCTTPNQDLVTFTTDFGVTFGVLMDEDLVISDVENMKRVKNFVMTGDWHSEVAFLNAVQFAPSWTYVTNANLVSTAGIYSGKEGLKIGSDKLAVADLYKDGGNDKPSVPSINPVTLNLPEDLSQYVLSPLNLDAGVIGYRDSICHRGFCCEFYVKTSQGGNQDVSYSLAAFNGIRETGHTNIGAQICALFTCTGTCGYKSCEMGSETKSNNIMFKRISITANFTKQNAQYPIVHSTAVIPTEQFKFDMKSDGISQQVTLQIVDTQNVVNLGIFGMKDLEKEYISSEKNSTESIQNEFYEYIFNEDVKEFFDYVWIRLRILIVVVSIYVLEMM